MASPAHAPIILVLLLVTALGGLAETQAQGFYERKQINMIVGTEAGAGFDAYGRVVARHIGRFIPGNPTVVAQNMPGAASGRAAEYIYTLAAKDGTAFGIVFPGVLLEPLTAGPGKYRFDPTKFAYLGSADTGVRMCITSKASKVRTFDDAMKMSAHVGGAGPGAALYDYALMLNKLANAKFKIISGYRSSLDTMMAIERRELDGLCGLDMSSLRALRPTWADGGEANLIIQVALEPRRDLLERGVPSVWDYVTGENRKAAEIVIAQQEFQRPFIAPPEMPAERLEILRKAFMAALTDSEALAEATKHGLTIGPKDGATVAALVQQLYSSPPEVVDRLRQALRP